MRRKIEKALLDWKTSQIRKPLIINGARQVGKTYSVLQFGKQQFSQVVHLDFIAQRSIAHLFDDDITPNALLPQIEVMTRQTIDPQNTLLFFDEVQACPRALTALKYFFEQAPEYYVIAAGSLLGVSLARDEESYPVGKVDGCTLYPLDFEEFCWAAGEEKLCGLIRESYANNASFGLHEYAIDLYRKYLVVGGMPEAVQRYFANGDMAPVRTVQARLCEGYIADMTKYASPLDSAKILNVWRSVPEQLAKENHKFQYATIASSARAHQYEAAIHWLHAAGMVNFCYRVREGVRPLSSYVEHDYFKLYLLDVGLLGYLQGIEPQDLLPVSDKGSRIRGGMTENYVMQQLMAAGLQVFYWGTTSRSEVDFLVQLGEDAIPIEVKSGKNVTARSLEAFRKAYKPPYVMRLSTKNFGFENGIRSVPLYAAFCLAGA